MMSLLFKDLLNPNNRNILEPLEISSLALKQISRGRFEIKGKEIISRIRHNKEEMEVIFTNELRIKDFQEQLYIAVNKEQSLDFMYNKIFMCNDDELTLLQMIEDYKQKYYIIGSKIEDAIWFKLYNKSESEDYMRKVYEAEWIDYEKQLKDGNIIYDSRGLCGLFAMPKEMIVKCFTKECKNRYGDNLFIVKLVPDCFYLDDEKEIIGDRFEVIDKIDLKCFEDLGRFINYLCQIDSKNAEKIKEELENRIWLLERENTKLKEDLTILDSASKRDKLTKWTYLIVGVITGVLMS